MPNLLKKQKSFEELKEISNKLRKRIIETGANSKIPHIGSCLSCIDLLVYIYWNELEIDPLEPNDVNRDRFLLSKGHGAPALFQVLAERGFFDKERLLEFGMPGSVFHEHPPKPGLIPGIEAATGSLGHGFSMALGMAVSSKITAKNYRTYVILSDGECNEGSIWEGAMSASNFNLDNLTVVVDHNKFQQTGSNDEIMKLNNLREKWISFGWETIEIDGHDIEKLKYFLAKDKEKKPRAIIANTIKGKGFSFSENNNSWHHAVMTKKFYDQAKEELEKNFKL